MARNANRIPKIVEQLTAVWTANPDLRLGQIIMGAAREMEPAVRAPGVFFLEDDEILEGLRRLETRIREARGEREEAIARRS